jgi:DNA-directed RNA polymerase specialized sigma24 family protein
MDDLQTLLESWLLRGGPDRPAIDRLCQEWRPIIRRYLVEPDEAELQDALQQALLTLVLSKRIVSRQPDKAPAWRRQILKNHLADGVRKRGRRQHTEQAQRLGLAPQAEREA